MLKRETGSVNEKDHLGKHPRHCCFTRLAEGVTSKDHCVNNTPFVHIGMFPRHVLCIIQIKRLVLLSNVLFYPGNPSNSKLGTARWCSPRNRMD